MNRRQINNLGRGVEGVTACKHSVVGYHERPHSRGVPVGEPSRWQIRSAVIVGNPSARLIRPDPASYHGHETFTKKWVICSINVSTLDTLWRAYTPLETIQRSEVTDPNEAQIGTSFSFIFFW